MKKSNKSNFQRVTDGADGHYGQWVDAAIASYGKKELNSLFEIAEVNRNTINWQSVHMWSGCRENCTERESSS